MEKLDEYLLKKIKALTPKKEAYYEMIGAKIVRVMSDRKCKCCGKEINKGDKAITASHYMDKLNGVSYRDAIDNCTATRGHLYRAVRHWFCLGCAVEILNKSSIDSRQEKMKSLIGNNVVEELNKAYENGEITAIEYEDIEMSIIAHEAYIDAVGIGQE